MLERVFPYPYARLDDVRAEMERAARRFSARPGTLPLNAALNAHNSIVHRFADAVGCTFTQLHAEVAEEWPPGEGEFGLLFDGWLCKPLSRSHPTRDLDLRFSVRRGRFANSDDGLVATVDYLYLPTKLQRRGLGFCLLEALAVVWAQMGLPEVHADFAPGNGQARAAFAKWGFLPRHQEDARLLGLYRTLPF